MRREDQVQRAIIDYLEAVVPGVFVFAIPNAAWRTRDGKAGNAVPGLRRGMPDLGFIVGGITYYVEVKTEHGRLSQAQWICLAELDEAHAPKVVVSSVEEMRDMLRYWNIETREAAA